MDKKTETASTPPAVEVQTIQPPIQPEKPKTMAELELTPIVIKNHHFDPNMRVYCLHHSSDHDGMISAVIMKTYFRDVWFIGCNYSKPINFNQIPPGSVVFICDFTLPADDMRWLCKYNTVVWCEHHATAWEQEYEEFKDLEGIRSTECSAAKLTWRYLHPDEPCPRSITLVSDYDTWHFEDPDTLPFHYGLELYNINPRQTSDVFLRKLFYNYEFMNSLIAMGKRIDAFINLKNKFISDDLAFVSEINGHKVLCANIRNCNSKVLDEAAKKHPEIKLRSTFGYNSTLNKFKCSLYSDDPTLVCQDIDARFHGHRSAAGCELEYKDLPYKLPAHDLKEPQMEDYITELNKIYNSDPLIFRHDASSLGYLCKLAGFPGKFENMDAFIVNHPYWHVSAMYNTNLITEYQIVVFWNLTGSGWYRYRIYPLEKNRMELKDLVHLIPGGKIVGDAIWCYRDKPIENTFGDGSIQEFGARTPYNPTSTFASAKRNSSWKN